MLLSCDIFSHSERLVTGEIATSYRSESGKGKENPIPWERREFPAVRYSARFTDWNHSRVFRNSADLTDRYFTQVSAARDKVILSCVIILSNVPIYDGATIYATIPV